MLTEYFIRNSDNAIKLTLTEDGVAISGTWTGLDIIIGSVTLHRTANGDGITLNSSTGLLTLNPGDLLPAEITLINALQKGFQPVQIVVTSAANDDGTVFGGSANDRIRFFVSDKP
jgi:hypothetical protein